MNSSADPRAEKTTGQRFTIIEGSIRDDIYVEQPSFNRQHCEILVIKIHNHTYHVPDERVSYIEDGHRYFFNDDEDGYGHDIELSPDKRWLFVTRKCMHTVGIGYLYQRINTRGFVPIRPYGVRFDEAAIKFFARICGSPQPLLSQGSRITGFRNWDRDFRGITFDLSVGINRPRDARGVYIMGHYDLLKHKFRLVHKRNW